MTAKIEIEVWDRDMTKCKLTKSFGDASSLLAFAIAFRAKKTPDHLKVHIPLSLADDRMAEVAALGVELF